MRSSSWMSALAVVVGLLTAPGAGAAGGGACVSAAKSQYVEGLRSCKEAMQDGKDTCLDRDHACVDVCREEAYQCVADSGLPGDIAACNATRNVQVGNCQAIYPPGSVERDQCIDNAQIDAFRCRDAARATHGSEIKACRTTFKGCAGLCGPATARIDMIACKRQVKADFKACKATTREDFQLNKDVCRGLGHTCVEQCRALRHDCVELVGLDAAIASCEATKATAVQTCRDGNPPGAARDECINQVQVVAFQCRDQAREDALPGLTACRADFQACVHPACEGASPSGSFLD